MPRLLILGLPTCRNPTLKECEDDTHTPKMGTGESFRTPKNSEFDCKGQTPRLEVFLIPLERSWSVNVENDLAWAIWTFVTQIMDEKRAENQTSSLTPDH
jgi:hypothetical protein